MTEATKRPWGCYGFPSSVSCNPNDAWFLIGPPVVVLDKTAGLSRADAALIVLAVNAHDALVEALEEIARGQGAFSRDPLEHAGNTIDHAKSTARAALALASGEQP